MNNMEEVEILGEQVDKSCRNCGVRFGSGKLAQTVGNGEAQRQRAPICVKCEYNPNMALVKSIGGGLIEFIVGKIVDNWRPITDDDKCCPTCKIRRTVNAMGECEEARVIVKNNCLLCKFGKNAALIDATHKKFKIEKPLADNWQSFEEIT